MVDRFLAGIPRNAVLLFALVLLVLVGPIVPIEKDWFIVELMFNFILISGVYTVGPTRHHLPFMVLTAITLAVRWGELVSGVRGLDVTALTLTATWLFYAVWIIMTNLFKRTDVTVNTILGAIVTYMLTAVAFAMVFQIIEITAPDSFRGLPENILDDRPELSNTMLYFSFVCITTMGYGDIVPIGGIAQPVAVLEGVFGQLYLAVMIARLVGLHIATSASGD
jgi:hypothetical protein